MSDGAALNIDTLGLSKEADRVTRHYLSAGTRAIAITTRDTEHRLEAATRDAAPGRLWRAWASDSYPRRGPARDPVGVIFVKGGARSRGAIAFWSRPGEVRGSRGQYLAVPLPAAGARGRTRDLTPEQWEQRTGIKLRPVFRPGRAPLLVADNAVLSGGRQVARSNTARRTAAGRGSTTVPIFVLLPMVRFRNTVAVEPILLQAQQNLAETYIREIGSASG